MNIYNALIYKKLYGGGGGGEIEVESLTATENKTYNAGEGKAYNPVVVAIPEPTLISKNITANGNYSASADNADGYSSVSVNVPLPSNAYLLQTKEHESIATFTDGTDNFLKSLEVAIEPVQSGSGEPSPTNIRPISGWDEVNVTRCGKNLWANGNLENVTRVSINGINLFPNTYTISAVATSTDTDANTCGVIFEYTDGTNSSIGQLSRNTRSSCTIVATKKVAKIAFYASDNYEHSASDTFSISDIQIEIGDTPTTYELYNGQTYTIDLNGKRYGGKLDVVNGVLTVGGIRETVDPSKFEGTSGGGLGWIDFNDSYVESLQNNNVMCSKLGDMVDSGTGWTSNAPCIAFRADPHVFRLYGNSALFSNGGAYENTTIYYKLKTPFSIQLSPTIIKSLQGDNNFFASTGEIELLQYWSKEVTS